LTLDVSLPAPGQVVIWINNSYLELVDHNSWVPEPAETIAAGAETGLVYEPAERSLDLHLDTRFAPSISAGRHSLAIRVEAASESIVFQVSTWVVP
jgi:hypothetical protein